MVYNAILRRFPLDLYSVYADGENTFSIDCISDSDGEEWLLDINVCLDLDYEIIVCPTYVQTSCTSEMIYYKPIDV